jgi:2-oxo-4-hydroxy-4-carboxy-5-ureidoimidazoline decarboxylase
MKSSASGLRRECAVVAWFEEMISSLAELSNAEYEQALQALITCCGSRKWAERIVVSRPFASIDSLVSAAQLASAELTDDDWREAISTHPRIGERAATPDTQHAAWSSQEQTGVQAAHRVLLDEIREANLAYERRFGYTFIVCATGKSAEEMLSICRERLSHSPADELQYAAEELRRIAEIRLRKLTGGTA